MSIDILLDNDQVIEPSADFKHKALFNDQAIYQKAQSNPLLFWEEQASELHWFKPWTKTLNWNRPYSEWFVDGKLNASYNCLDRHIKKGLGSKTAFIWESETGQTIQLSYQDVYDKVNQFAYQLKHKLAIKKGDRVTIYMPMIPEIIVAVLACARIGAIHSVVFGGFSAQSLKDRINDSQSKLVITANGGFRRGKVIPLKETVDKSLSNWDHPVEHVVVVNYIDDLAISYNSCDIRYDDLMADGQHYCEPEEMDSEDKLFILYTSGTTGKPKGIIHTTGGYLTHAKYSTKAVFDLKDDDVYWCTADVGWITGHTYLIYGPMANAATLFIYEGVPDFPHQARFWELIDKHRVSILYTAPTAIRAFMKWGSDCLKSYSLSSLRLLGTVGEPINPEAWMWYYTYIGKKQCPVVDTWWQTETGGIMIAGLPGIEPMKPGTAGLPLPGISASILSPTGDKVSHGGGLLSLTQPWPSMLRGVWGDEVRYQETYWAKFDTYFAGDGASVDEDGYIKVIGRVDDVLNVAGHRIGTMEVESALVDHSAVAEAAVIGIPDEIKGEAIVGFVILKESALPTPELNSELIQHVSQLIGAIAKPKRLIFTPDLPKTRSGKIIRRALRQLAQNQDVGDTTTLANPDIIETIKATLMM